MRLCKGDWRMKKTRLIGIALLLIAVIYGLIKKCYKKNQYSTFSTSRIISRKRGLYERYIKRCFDIIASVGAIICLSPIYIIVALLVRARLGSPIIFTQKRPGIIGKNGRETIFKMYKFRTMTDERDADGNLLPDDKRLTKFGAWLRSTSLDELPELFNILEGTMSLIGPRPQLVRDMVFMTDKQRERHTAKPGLSGLAQINGRNAIRWEDKLAWDLKYIQRISFKEDMRIIYETINKAFLKREGITDGENATALDYGDYLLSENKISKEYYDEKQLEARNILEKKVCNRENGLVSIIMPSYNTAEYIMDSITSVRNQTYKNWELLIVDDCSTDTTKEIMAKINDPRIKIFYNERNSGAAVSRNRALREAKGQWIAFLDSDDLWMPDKLEKQIKFMEDNEYAFSYTNYEEINSNGDKTGIKVTGPKHISETGMFNYCWPGCLTVMYNAEKIGLVQIEDIKKNNDYAMWLKVIKRADCYLLGETLALYRRGRKGSISTNSVITMLKWHYKLFRICEQKNILSSMLHTIFNVIYGIYKKLYYVR